MLAGLVSDTHGNAKIWSRLINQYWADVDMLIHAGDVLYHGPRNPLVDGYDPLRLSELINECPCPVIMVKGNCDAEVDELVLDYPLQNPYALIQKGGLRILVNHGHNLSADEKLITARKHKADILITGHTHIPFLEKKEGVAFVNPGSCALPKGDKPTPTVAFLDLHAEEIRIIDLSSGKTWGRLKI